MKAHAWLLAGLVAVLLLIVPACDDDEDDDSNSSDDDDNDDLGDDDLSDDDVTDDDVVDDDAGDDDAGDDDVDDDIDDDDTGDDDTEPTYLMIVGESMFNNFRSHLQTNQGWVVQDIPEPPETPYFPPATIGMPADGFGYGVWNNNDLPYEHTWLVYERETGWRLDAERPLAAENAHVDQIVTLAPGAMWAMAHTGESPDYFLVRYDGLTRYEELVSQNITDFGYLQFFSADSGLAAMDIDAVPRLLAYREGQWSVQPLPTLLADSRIIQSDLVDENNGWLVVNRPGTGGSLEVVRLANGEAEFVAPPTGCEDVSVAHLRGNASRAVVITDDPYDDRFWDYRDGEWSCLHYGTSGGMVSIMHEVVLRTGRVFVLACVTSIYNPPSCALGEVMNDGIEFIDIGVGDYYTMYALFAFGPQAPPYGYYRYFYY